MSHPEEKKVWLIVDDNEPNLETLLNITQRALPDTKVWAAASYDEAVTLIKTMLNQGNQPVAVVSDWKLWSGEEQGNNKSGIDVLKYVQGVSPTTIRVLYSAYGGNSDIVIGAAREAHIHDFLTKVGEEIDSVRFGTKIREWYELYRICARPVSKMKGLMQCDPSFLDPTFINDLPFVKKALSILPDLLLVNLHDEVTRKRNAQLLLKTSKIMHNVIADTGGWRMPEQNYRQDPNYLTEVPNHVPDLDALIMANKNAQSLKTRFEYLTQKLLPEMIETLLKDRDEIHIASLGSGAGTDLLTVISNMRKDGIRGKIKCDLVDIDSAAIVVGLQYWHDMGYKVMVNKPEIAPPNLNRYAEPSADFDVRFHLGSFLDPNFIKSQNNNYDLVLKIGIICPTLDDTAAGLLRTTRSMLSPDGYEVVSSGSKKMVDEDPEGRFLREYFAGWALNPRTVQSFEDIGKKAGLRLCRVEQEPMGYHLMGIYRSGNNQKS